MQPGGRPWGAAGQVPSGPAEPQDTLGAPVQVAPAELTGSQNTPGPIDPQQSVDDPGQASSSASTSSLRHSAHRFFGKPTTVERWSVGLGGPLEFQPVASPEGLQALVELPPPEPGQPAPQQRQLLTPAGEVQPGDSVTDGYAAPTAVTADGTRVDMTWQTSMKLQFDSMIGWQPEYRHDSIRIQGQGPGGSWVRELKRVPDKEPMGMYLPGVDRSRPYPWGPQACGDRVVVPRDERSLECLDSAGNTLWVHQGTPWAKFDFPPSLSPDGRAVVADNNHGVLTAYGPDGKQQWEQTLFKHIRCQPLLLEDGSTLVLTQGESGKSRLLQLDAQGQPGPSWELDGSFYTGMARAQDGTLVLADGHPARLVGLDLRDGLRWEHPLPEAPLGNPQVLPDGSVLAVTRAGRAVAVQVRDPRTDASAEPPPPVGGIHEAEDWIIVGGVRVRRQGRSAAPADLD